MPVCQHNPNLCGNREANEPPPYQGQTYSRCCTTTALWVYSELCHKFQWQNSEESQAAGDNPSPPREWRWNLTKYTMFQQFQHQAAGDLETKLYPVPTNTSRLHWVLGILASTKVLSLAQPGAPSDEHELSAHSQPGQSLPS